MLALVTAGLSNQEIANTLSLRINSVKTYIRNTYRKMGVATRPQAVLWAIQHGVPDARTTVALADRHRASQPVALAAPSTRVDTFPAPRRAPLHTPMRRASPVT